MSLTQDMVNDSGDEALLKLAADSSHQDSGGALWMLLLLRLTSVATDQRLELRNSEFFFEVHGVMRLTNMFRRCHPNSASNHIGLRG